MAKNKKSKYPEWYIGRPKPMKVKKQIFHKPTVKDYVKLGIFLVIAGLIAWLAVLLVNFENTHELDFEYYAFEEAKQPQSYVLENSDLKFELNPVSTTFTVTQKSNGHVWYSNPQNIDSDPIALKKEKDNMRSPLLLKYSTVNGSDEVYDIYTNSIQRKFYDVEKQGSEVVVKYTIGQMDREYIFPPIIYEDRLLKYEEGLSRSQVSAINRAYHKYDIENPKTGDDIEGLLAKYPEFKDQPVYLVFENIQTYLKEQMEATFESVGYTYDDYLKDKEMYKESNIKDLPAFDVTVRYSLEGNNLVVKIPYEEISYKSKYPITQLSVLPYFGAAGTQDEGFIFVPEGSGSLINFNNGKTRQNGYYADAYGWDYATDRKALITETRAAFPVMGMSYGDASFISIPVEGSEYAGFTAEIAGKLGSYNYVRVDYKMLHREQYETSARSISAQYSYEKGLPNESIVQKYTFINGGSYVDMAKAYQKYLFAGEKKLNDSELPVSVEIVGAIDKVQQVMGMPKVLPFEVTSYKEAAKIISEIDEMGIKNANIKLSGSLNGGVRQKILNKVKFVKELGGAGDFKKLVEEVSKTSAKLYVDASVQNAYRSGLSDGFYNNRDAARFASDKLAELNEYSPIWYGKLTANQSYYLLNPKVAAKNTDVFAKNAKKLGYNISFTDNGYLLSGDYNDNRRVSRAYVRKSQIEKMDSIRENGTSVMINGGNDYALKSTDIITNMVFHGNSYALLDKTVPFYQIALHGYKNFTGLPVNLSYEINQVLLESAETGAGLNFTFMGKTAKSIQETDFTQYFAANFDGWKDELKSVYTKYNADFSPVKNCTITDHEYLTDDVVVTTFDNGTKVYVNFGYINYVTPEGVKVASREYKVVK